MMTQHFNTRIICPYSYPTYDEGLIKSLLDTKVDALRFNLQITKEAELQKVLDDLQKRPQNPKGPLQILDLYPSARARLGPKQEVTDLKFGQMVVFSNSDDSNSILFQSSHADSLFIEGCKVFLGYGEVTLEVQKIEKKATNVSVECKVLQSGTITESMAIHVPDSRPSYSTEDSFGIGKNFRELAAFAKDHFQAFILPSYFPANKLDDLRSAFFETGLPCPWLIQKIDTPSSFEHMKQYVDKVEGFLVSRRELSLGANPATVPMLTKEIFHFCKNHAKIVFTASEILGSMRFKSSPTRAEVSDLANAVIDGTDGIVISEEIPMNQKRIAALKLAHRVILDVEKAEEDSIPNWETIVPTIHNEMDAIALGSLRTARRVGAKAIVCITHSGNTALKLSSFKSKFPILAITFNDDVAKKLKLIRGVYSVLLDAPPKIDTILDSINSKISKLGILEKGDNYIFASVTLSSIGKSNSNLFSVQTLNG